MDRVSWLALLLAVLFLAPHSALSKSEFSLSIESMNDSLDLKEATINSIFIDRYRRLWVSESGKLIEFKGSKASIYSETAKDNGFVPFSNVSQIVSDKEGYIYVSSKNGYIAKYVENSSSFLSKRLATEPPQTDTFTSASSLSAGPTNLIVGTNSGILIYNKEYLRLIKTQKLANDGKEIGPIVSIVYVESDDFFIVISSNAIFKLKIGSTPTTDGFSISVSRILDFIDRPNVAFSDNSSDVVWIGTLNGTLYRVGKNSSVTKIFQLPTSGPLKTISSLSILKDTLYVGTHSGIYSVDLTSFSIRHLTKDNSNLTNDHITSLYSDENHLWIGTYYGLDRLSNSEIDLYTRENSGIENEVLAITNDAYSNLWIGTYEGLFLLEYGSSKHKKVDFSSETKTGDDIRVMCLTIFNNKLIVGSRWNGLYSLDLTTGKRSAIFPEELSNAQITSVLAIDNELWVSTFNKGLYVWRNSSIYSAIDGAGLGFTLPLKKITILTPDKAHKRIYIASEQEVFIYSIEKNSIDKLHMKFPGHNKPGVILSLLESSLEKLWVGTLNSGAFIATNIGDTKYEATFSSLLEGSHFSTLSVAAFQEDSSGAVWAATNDGLFKFSPHGRFVSRKGIEQGIQSSTFNFGASYKDSDGWLYFGGSNGYNRFHPDNIDPYTPIPPLVLTSFSVAGERPHTDSDLNTDNAIELTYNENYLTFEFSVLDYLDLRNNQYKYMLEGLDPDWVASGTRNTATYTNLEPGNYTFRVQGANSEGVWNYDGISLHFEILPPPWKTWWAYSIYGLIAAFLLWHAKKTYDNRIIRLRALKLANELQIAADRAMDDVQEQLDHQSRLLKTIHEFNLNRLQTLLNNPETNSDQLPLAEDLPRSHATALVCLEEALHYRDDALLVSLFSYTNLIVERLAAQQSCLAPEDITLINCVEDRLIPAKEALPLAMIVYELVSNALAHAFIDHVGAAIIKVSFEAEYDDATQASILKVEDSGIGMSQVTALGTNFTSGGLLRVSRYVQQLDAAMTIDASIGTRIEIRIPYLIAF